VIAVLLEDGSSIKKTAEEEKEERELAEKVNATLAAEEEKERQEKEEKEKKKRQDQEKKKTGTNQEKGTGTSGVEKGQDEACPTFNQTCPEQESCQPCPEVKDCSPCGVCPEENPCPAPVICPEQEECPELEVCPPTKFGPEIVDTSTVVVLNNSTDAHQECPAPPSCTDAGMSVPTALVVGACAGGLLTGVAAAIGLILRYVDPIVSGFFFVATVVLIWYFSSHYPETARELGARAATLLREAATALGHRIMEAIRHREDQVGFPNKPSLPKNEFHILFEKFALRFSM
jgi:uncharacterized membrane protein YphA (DoxX/SURF4 family)